MKNIGIHEPCSENWNAMTPTEQGRFCQQCATQVYDFTNKSASEIKQTLRSLVGKPVCGRLTPAQEETLNAEFDAWNFRSKRALQSALVFSLVVVFGLSLFSCSNEQDRQQIEQMRHTAVKAMQQTEAAPEQPVEVPQQIATVEEVDADPILYTAYGEVLEPVEVVPDVADYGYGRGGAVLLTCEYTDYLIETVEPVEGEPAGEGIPYPTTFASLAFPNPATTETTFELKVPVKNRFEIRLLDMNGKLIQTIHSGEIDRGTFRRQLDLIDLDPGMYIIAIVSKNYKESLRISKI